MIGVDGAGVVLEGLMVCRVVGLGAGVGGDGGTGAAGGAVGVGDGEVEATLKPAPGEAGGVEQVADVLAGHADRLGGAGADVAGGVGVADVGESAVAVRQRLQLPGLTVLTTPLVWPETTLIAPWCRRTEVRAEGVVVHGIVLGVVPESGDGVAVIVAHGEGLGGGRTGAGGAGRGVLGGGVGGTYVERGRGPSCRHQRPSARGRSCGSGWRSRPGAGQTEGV